MALSTSSKVSPKYTVCNLLLKPGDQLIARGGGGGGFGPPWQRPVEDVCEDVRQEYVSEAAAKELYGVIIDPETLQADAGATAALRAAIAAAG